MPKPSSNGRGSLNRRMRAQDKKVLGRSTTECALPGKPTADDGDNGCADDPSSGADDAHVPRSTQIGSSRGSPMPGPPKYLRPECGESSCGTPYIAQLSSSALGGRATMFRPQPFGRPQGGADNEARRQHECVASSRDPVLTMGNAWLAIIATALQVNLAIGQRTCLLTSWRPTSQTCHDC